MKISNVKQVDEFIDAVKNTRGSVWIESGQGDRLNLKSPLSMYVAIGKLVSEQGDKLELFCSLKEDEQAFFKFFDSNKEVL